MVSLRKLYYVALFTLNNQKIKWGNLFIEMGAFLLCDGTKKHSESDFPNKGPSITRALSNHVGVLQTELMSTVRPNY